MKFKTESCEHRTTTAQNNRSKMKTILSQFEKLMDGYFMSVLFIKLLNLALSHADYFCMLKQLSEKQIS